jgi:hypothetical protein
MRNRLREGAVEIGLDRDHRVRYGLQNDWLRLGLRHRGRRAAGLERIAGAFSLG